MQSKHTPGPWLHRGKSESVHRPSSTHPYGDFIFKFDDEEGLSDGDLALILAAPDLLTALKECRNAIQGGQTVDPYDSRGAGYEQTFGIAFVEHLNAVIAKATGEAV